MPHHDMHVIRKLGEVEGERGGRSRQSKTIEVIHEPPSQHHMLVRVIPQARFRMLVGTASTAAVRASIAIPAVTTSEVRRVGDCESHEHLFQNAYIRV